jgi:hypothetical protein
MIDQEFQEHRDMFTRWRFFLGDEKSKAYIGDSDDRLNNFKEMAAENETSPAQELMSLAGKHWMALKGWVFKGVIPSEGAAQSMADLANYIDLLYAMLVEDE